MLQTILSPFLHALIAFFLLMFVTRIMERKIISQMTFFDFAIAITLGSVTANLALGNPGIAIRASIILFTLALLDFITGYLHIKSFTIRKLVDSEPLTLIRNGEIVKNNMRKTRINLNELTSMLREKNVFNIADVEFAILEVDGKLSVLPKSQRQPLTPSDLNLPTPYRGLTKEIVIDGNIMYENLADAHLDEQWLMTQLENKGIKSVKDVFFAALDTSGNLYVSKGVVGREKEGHYGID